MKIPDNMTSDEVFIVIDSVCKSVSRNFSFDHFEPEDIYQEAYIICAEVIDKYDGQRPLENFLNVSVRNRLYNFRRDNSKYYKYQCDICNNEDSDNCDNCLRQRVLFNTKKNIDHPLNIDEVQSEVTYEINNADVMANKEMFLLINRNLPISMRTDYLKMLSDVYVNKNRRAEIVERIKDILTQNDCMDE